MSLKLLQNVLENRLQIVLLNGETSRKTIKTPHLSVVFNNVPVVQSSCQKHLGVYLDQKLNFTHRIKEKVTKANKGIAVIKKLQTKLPQNALFAIYKSFIRLHLDYAGIIYDQTNNDFFKNKLERIQYNAALPITGAIRGTSRDKIYEEL